MQQKTLSDYQATGRKTVHKCDYCGSPVIKYPSKVKGKVFCDVDCHEDSRATDSREVKDTSNHVSKPCTGCGDTVTRPPSQMDGNVFCGRRCHNEFQRAPVPELPHECPDCDDAFETERGLKVHHGHKHDGNSLKTELACKNCGDTFYRPPSQSHLKFCSPECGYGYGRGGTGVERVRRILADGPWREIATAVKDAAGWECEQCGTDPGRGKGGLQVHHLLPLRAGGTHADWNLRALCPTCHGKAEAFAHSHFEYSVLPAPGAFGQFHANE